MLLIQPILAFRPNRLDWIFASKTFLAGALALYIAFELNLAYPIWAIGTVFVIANPYKGLNLSKSVYRVLGTFIGAAVAVIFTPLLIHSPWLFTLFLAFWVGGCLYLSLLDRSPRSYAAMLAGYTSVIICYNIIYFIDTVTIFDMAFGRFLEISIGVMCSALVTNLIFPMSITPVVEKKLQKTLEDSNRLFKQVLLEDHQHNYVQLLAQMTQDITDLHQLLHQLAFERSALQKMTKPLQEMLHQLSLALTHLVAMSEHMQQLEQTEFACQHLEPIYSLVSSSLFQPFFTEDATEKLTQQIHLAFQQLLKPANTKHYVLLMSLKTDIQDFMTHIQAVHLLWHNIQHGDTNIPSQIVSVTTDYISLYRDHGAALRAASAAALTVFTATGFWMMSGWTAGFMLAEMAAISACILATMDNPVPALKMFIRGNIYAAIAVFIYAYGIFPQVTEFWQLILVLAPFCMYCLMLILHPPLTGIALPLLMGTIMGLNLKNSYQLDQVFFFDASIGTIMGPIIAVYMIYLVRAMSPDITAKRILKSHDQAMSNTLSLGCGRELRIHVRAMLDRIGLLNSKVVQSERIQQQINLSLVEVSAAIYFIRLYELQQQIHDQILASDLSQLQQQLQQYFQQRQHNLADQPQLEILKQHTQALMQYASTMCQSETQMRFAIAVNNIHHLICKQIHSVLHG